MLATYMYRDTPLVLLEFGENGRLVSKRNLEKIEGRDYLNLVHLLNVGEMEAYLLNRRISFGRNNRSEIYFGGKTVTPFEELRIYRAADHDDCCWLKFEDDNSTAKDVFGCWI